MPFPSLTSRRKTGNVLGCTIKPIACAFDAKHCLRSCPITFVYRCCATHLRCTSNWWPDERFMTIQRQRRARFASTLLIPKTSGATSCDRLTGLKFGFRDASMPMPPGMLSLLTSKPGRVRMPMCRRWATEAFTADNFPEVIKVRSNPCIVVTEAIRMLASESSQTAMFFNEMSSRRLRPRTPPAGSRKGRRSTRTTRRTAEAESNCRWVH